MSELFIQDLGDRPDKSSIFVKEDEASSNLLGEVLETSAGAAKLRVPITLAYPEGGSISKLHPLEKQPASSDMLMEGGCIPKLDVLEKEPINKVEDWKSKV